MKVVFFRHSLLSRGGDKMIVAHANHLVAVGHDVCITAAVVDTVFTLDPLISLNILPTQNKLATIFAAFTSSIETDLIIADIIPMACFLFPSYRRKVVYFAQDYDESYYSSRYMKDVIRFFYFIGLNQMRIQAIAVSSFLANLLGNRFHEEVIVAENGVDTNVFFHDPDPTLIAAKCLRKAVLLHSRNDVRKGFDVAKEVIARLSQVYPTEFEVWTVGQPSDGQFLGLIHRDFGYVNEVKLRQIMSSADVFLYPTRHEGFGLMPLEAFACRCPVVTTEAVTFALHLENSLVADLDNCEQLTEHTAVALADSALVERITSNGLLTAKNLSLEISVERFESALRLIVAGY